MISSFRIKNLRSIKDSGRIGIRKINILVGRNSSGKSTVLRFLPLLRQSVEQPTKGPLLWYGRLVDFGSFENAARDNDPVRGVEIEFDVVLPRRAASSRSILQAQSRKASDTALSWGPLKARVSIALGRSERDKVGNVRSASIVIYDDVVEIDFNEDGINKLSALDKEIELEPKQSWAFYSGKLFPAPVLIQEVIFQDENGERHKFQDVAAQPFLADVLASLRQIAHGKTSDERLGSIASRLIYSDAGNFYDALVDLPGVSEDLRSRVKYLGPHSEELKDLRRWVLLSKLTQLVQLMDDEIASFAESVNYIEPLRATAERYYRQQDLAVGEIDSRGANTAMFLESLSIYELQELQVWMRDNLGFWVVIEPGVGHVQVKIQDEFHRPRNIADLGFGYSQILPIALQLWRSSRRQYQISRKPFLLAMEQPELHLHPEYQARLADVIAVCSKSGSSAIPFRAFIETHSDHLINRFGRLVGDGIIDARDIQVLVVSDSDSDCSSVVRVSFDKDGYLDGSWPVGFFTPEAK